MPKTLLIMALINIPLHCIAATITLNIDRQIDPQTFPRYGLNLGGPSYWGAEQLRANIVRNPGFMPLLDRSIVLVEQVEGRQIKDKDAWVARPDGFWTGGRYQILSGAHANMQGRIFDYRRKAQSNGLFWLDQNLNELRIGDAISVEKTSQSQAIPQWWSSGRTSLVAKKEGGFAARLQPSQQTAAALASYFDSLGGTAGRLLPVAGDWQLKFKVRSERAGAKLQVRFARDKQTAFVHQTIEPTAQWQTIELDWRGSEGVSNTSAPLSLTFQAEGDGEIWVDDVYLGEKSPLPSGFRRVVVDTLKTLRPGYLRDWQGQLGDNVPNRFIGEMARHPIRYRPGENESFFAYSIPDFFSLCAQIQAHPWVVGPTTLSRAEWFNFGKQLRIHADQAQLREVVLEFGNENWNALFRPAGFTDVRQHQQIADEALAAAKKGFGDGSKLITVVNAPFLWGDSPGAIIHSKVADRVAVAPYFLYKIDNNETEKQLRQRALASQLPLLVKQQQLSKAKNKPLAVYEINFHSSMGNAPAALRNLVLNNGIAGVALARQLIDSSLVGIREQAVYTLAGYSLKLENSLGDVPLFGISRDLSEANRLRPTGLALAMLNEVAGGHIHAVGCTSETDACNALSAVMFNKEQKQQFAIVNASESSHSLRMPCRSPIKWAILNGHKISDHELAGSKLIQNSKANCLNGVTSITLPAQSLLIATPER
ncbi:hypothetical protein HQN60_13900 [Deefgea piscis]|uniref:CBM-cenC domain-containing protein n=1 Tax=Deefgea piscis TaxID=2739061 RepID=A0A6M8SSM9_9NEIS|nr:hypothetical protein [Deefgea piscis]QKJ67721.1 hypothetical protein HQN60_13900 [Deefgea piscis]